MTLWKGVTVMAQAEVPNAADGLVLRAVWPGQSRELIRRYRQGQRAVDRLRSLLEQAGLGSEVISVAVSLDDAGNAVGHLAMTVDGLGRLVELLHHAGALAPEHPVAWGFDAA